MTPAPLGVPLILILQPIKHINQCQLYVSISERVGVGDSLTITGTGIGLAVSAAAGACPTVECVPTQFVLHPHKVTPDHNRTKRGLPNT